MHKQNEKASISRYVEEKVHRRIEDMAQDIDVQAKMISDQVI